MNYAIKQVFVRMKLNPVSLVIKLNKRSKQIFELLRDHYHGITGEKIAEQLGVSSRTIRSDIKILQRAIPDIKILSSPNHWLSLNSLEDVDEIYRKSFVNLMKDLKRQDRG